MTVLIYNTNKQTKTVAIVLYINCRDNISNKLKVQCICTIWQVINISASIVITMRFDNLSLSYV